MALALLSAYTILVGLCSIAISSFFNWSYWVSIPMCAIIIFIALITE